MFLEPEKLFFFAKPKPGLSEFHKVSVQKKIESDFFAKQSFSKFHKSSLEKNIFLEPEMFFLQSRVSFSFKE